ncbi:MAG: NADH-quinone oxidoreductase subunit J [Chloroflexi bacterium]|nr:NADH-quinone oxidoreductase subunit J [Chloroflexota bacterium]MDK1045096.1 NADH-quinone oxidoreductase subunit J [Anaerolineales bacterium]MCH8341904.1 NADH-quinone oxidoreductase subunit J [Chloroflexota bacterium]MCH8877323.1 NADH-quinone oxidoreductase subunit J [Chloroflexota bacterium]MCI0773635.1 NADH-quinone oxidoreductase subunit J [Chloroflexota bacterium]
MTLAQLIFLAAAAVTLVAAIMVVTSPRLIHAGLWLILSLAGIAVLFILLDNGFLAVVQVAIYIDAIAILIIIAVMLTRAVMSDADRQINRMGLAAAFASLILLAGLLAMVLQVPAASPAPLVEAEVNLDALGRALVDVDGFILPFEVASVMLVAALVGAILVAMAPARGD